MIHPGIVMLITGAADSSGSTRLLLLVLLLIAIVLILAGCSIALLTFRKQRSASNASKRI